MSRDIFLRLLFSIFIVILIFALHRLITVSPRSDRPVWSANRPLLFAHRGGSAMAPENTLPAFENGVRFEADAIETDVRLTADGELVIFHDETLERTTDGSGKVLDHTLAELKQLDAGYQFTPDGGATYPFRGQGVQIMTPAELFAAFPGLIINIDIKDPLPEAAERLAEEIERAGADDRTSVGSFYDDVVARFRAVAPTVATAAGPNEIRWFYILHRLRLSRFHRALSDAYQLPTHSDGTRLDSARFIADAHKLNQQVHYWTIDDPAEMRRLLSLGADGIMTDRPDLALEVFRELGLK